MESYTRACVAYVALRLISGQQSGSASDHTQGRHISIGGTERLLGLLSGLGLIQSFRKRSMRLLVNYRCRLAIDERGPSNPINRLKA